LFFGFLSWCQNLMLSRIATPQLPFNYLSA
jgi:hypothetical protein